MAAAAAPAVTARTAGMGGGGAGRHPDRRSPAARPAAPGAVAQAAWRCPRTPAPAARHRDAAIGGAPTDALAPDASSADAAVDPDGSVDIVCTPCATDADCGGGTCLDVDGARFCTIHCAESAECGAGRICEPVDGQEGSFCLPADSCDAPPDCTDNDGDGYGEGASCLGPGLRRRRRPTSTRVSGDPCDGRNDDCDEVTDEDFAVETCGVGACVASSACVGGQVVACSPGVPVGDDSLCNGLDDDCDGSVDEAYVAQPCGFGVCAAESSCENGQEIACVPGDPLLTPTTRPATASTTTATARRTRTSSVSPVARAPVAPRGSAGTVSRSARRTRPSRRTTSPATASTTTAMARRTRSSRR